MGQIRKFRKAEQQKKEQGSMGKEILQQQQQQKTKICGSRIIGRKKSGGVGNVAEQNFPSLWVSGSTE